MMPWRPGKPGWLIHHFGRRGVFLIMFGLIYLVFGALTFVIDTHRFDDIPYVGPILDSPLWGILWFASGAVSVGIGIARGYGAHDGLGFTALLLPPVLWSTFYATSFVAWVLTGGHHGRLLSLPSLLVWSVVWTVVLLIAGWPDPTRPMHAEPLTLPADPKDR